LHGAAGYGFSMSRGGQRQSLLMMWLAFVVVIIRWQARQPCLGGGTTRPSWKTTVFTSALRCSIALEQKRLSRALRATETPSLT